MSKAFLSILLTTLGLISLAGLLNFFFKKLYPQKEVFKKVSQIINGWWFIVCFVLICFGLAPLGLLVGFGLATLFGAREFLRYSQLKSMHNTFMALVSLSLILQYYSLWIHHWSLFFAIPLIFILLGFPAIVVATGAIEKLPLVFSSYVGLLFITHFVAYLPAVYMYTSIHLGTDQAIYFSFFIIMLTELNDIFQFLAGKSFGKRKLVPLVSPNKTEAGFVGGLLGTSLTSYLLLTNVLSFDWFHSLTIGVLISFSGILGDLCFSAIKRYFGTKDFSDLLPGHGGVFDRLDSLIFTTPITFLYVYLLKGF